MGKDTATVVHRPDEARYVLLLGRRQVGELTYRDRGGNVVAFLHAEVEPALEGQRLGSRLVAGALDDARERGLQVVPRCAFIAAFARRHPEYADVVIADPARR